MKYRIALALVFVTVASFGASADTPEERNACMGDAFKVCGHAIPSRERVIACLYDNKSSISTACREVLTRKPRPDTSAARIKATTIR